MDTWLVALVGVAGSLAGASLAILGNKLSADREDNRARVTRLAESKLRVYLPVLQWIGRVDEQLHSVYYSFSDYVNAPFLAAEDPWPTPIAEKRAEYRKLDPPDQWALPENLGEATIAQLQGFAQPEIVTLTQSAEQFAVQFADEAMSLGRHVIADRHRPSEDVDTARRVVSSKYKLWIVGSNSLLNAIRRDLDATAEAIPVDPSRLPQTEEIQA